MVIGVVDQAVVGEDDALGTAGLGVEGVNVTFRPGAAIGIGQEAFVVAEVVAADTHAVGVVIQTAAAPAQLLGASADTFLL